MSILMKSPASIAQSEKDVGCLLRLPRLAFLIVFTAFDVLICEAVALFSSMTFPPKRATLSFHKSVIPSVPGTLGKHLIFSLRLGDPRCSHFNGDVVRLQQTSWGIMGLMPVHHCLISSSSAWISYQMSCTISHSLVSSHCSSVNRLFSSTDIYCTDDNPMPQ